MVDAGANPYVGDNHVARFSCRLCQWESDWMGMPTVRSIRIGIPCPNCNNPAAPKP